MPPNRPPHVNSRAAAINILCQWHKSHSAITPFMERYTRVMTEGRDRQRVQARV
ncbi:MAG: hypothetical protein GXP59_05770, partial [Deltaproteobacteria bacterium]|nr:hypothetical protein [Deltaproteobacteria bacterium]